MRKPQKNRVVRLRDEGSMENTLKVVIEARNLLFQPSSSVLTHLPAWSVVLTDPPAIFDHFSITASEKIFFFRKIKQTDRKVNKQNKYKIHFIF